MLKKYNILLSAYACEPNKGSEPGVGWNWAIELAKLGHQVWVLTRSNNKANIDKESSLKKQLPNLKFVYYDLPNYLRFWKKGAFGVHAYYFFWQLGIIRVAKKLDQKICFEVIHHITFVSIHQPSFLYKLKKPFIFGPIGGGEETPSKLVQSFKFKYRIKEYVRYVYNRFTKYCDPLIKRTFIKSSLIFSTSLETKNIIPIEYHKKCYVKLAIGVDKLYNDSSSTKKENFNILFVGRFLHWKGIHFALKAMKNLDNKKNKLTLIGKGEFKKELDQIVNRYEIDNINWVEWMSQSKLYDKFKKADCLLFPSLRDSGGMVVLEALSKGLPVICLDLGGPGQIVNNDCGRVISTKDRSEPEVIEELSEALNELYSDPILRKRLSEGAIRRAKEFKWSKIVSDTYEIIEREVMNENTANT